jgi:phage FluMu gp28-like protein
MPVASDANAPPTVTTKGPLIVVKRTEQEFHDWIATEEGFLTAFASFDENPISLEPYQSSFLAARNTDGTQASYRCVEKSRQVGYSWIFACESLARSHLRLSHNSIFVSYNLADAKEKIAYCQQIHEQLPLEYQKKRIVDSKLEIAFQGNDAQKRITRIISNPSKAPRGKKGDIYLDELAHCANDREIYKGSTALVLRASSQLTVCSSPLGRRGVFWEIARQEVKPYRTYWRQAVPWWLCGISMCRDIRTAAREAPKLSTAERVARFGKKAIQDQFNSLLLEDFQQEFECVYSDETMTFYPYELILPCCDAELELCEEFTDVRRARQGRLTAGFDVGRRRDLSELTIFDELPGGERVMLMSRSYDKVPFAEQEGDLLTMLDMLPIVRLSIDDNGIGMHLAENLSREFPEVVVPESFTAPNKEVWCTDFKIALQRKTIRMPKDRKLIAQIHSIKKNVTAGGRVTFDVERDASMKGHADKFWSAAIATRKERGEQRSSASVHARVLG